jgi:hypothetical protein
MARDPQQPGSGATDMTIAVRLVAVAGLLVLLSAGLFPPLKRPAGLPYGSTGPFGCRALLFAGDYTFKETHQGSESGRGGGGIYGSRLFAEVVLVGSATLVAVILLYRPQSVRSI